MGTIRAFSDALGQVAEREPDKFPTFFDAAVVDLILALGFWSLSGKDDPTATVAFWRGIKALYKLQNTPAVESLVGAFEILEPLLNQANPDLIRSAVLEGRSDWDPLTRALFIILQGFAGRAQA